MRAVIQRVIRASVRVGDDLISSIDRGLCVLVGITHEDDQSDIDYLVKKLLAIRLWPSADGSRNWTRNVVEVDGSLLCVSQFTLHATLKGNKPDFHLAMAGDQSKIFYEKFVLRLREHYRAEKICDGQFGALMNVQIGKWKQLSLEAGVGQLTRSETEDAVETCDATPEALRAHPLFFVSLENDGPVTILLDSRAKKSNAPAEDD